MTEHSDKTENAEKTLESNKRRKLIAGSAVAPILMALASRPVLGAQNCAPSGFMSGNLSHPDAYGSCGGYNVHYWKNHLNWPHPYIAGTCTLDSYNNPRCDQGVNGDGTLFSTVFPYTDNANKTLLQVLWQVNNNWLAPHAVAALLNAASGIPGYVLSTAEVIDIYSQVRQNGYYQTTSGINMDAVECRDFFANTFA